jgi:TPP-dependent trihydroxycyclohexane-1,2-dione (THcHDO) dehydratase
MAAASAGTHKTKHHHHHKAKAKAKAKHHVAAAKGGLSPGSSLCVAIANSASSSSNVGLAIEKSLEEGATGSWATAQQAMLATINASLSEASQAEADLSSAPADVQAAMKGIYAFVEGYKTAISNASSVAQFGEAMGSLAANSNVKADSLTLEAYVTAQCGSTTPTT